MSSIMIQKAAGQHTLTRRQGGAVEKPSHAFLSTKRGLMLHSRNISNVNPRSEISVADGLRCPSCEAVIRAIDTETRAPWGFRIACRNCRRDIVACEPTR
jgi:hypothetical protein